MRGAEVDSDHWVRFFRHPMLGPLLVNGSWVVVPSCAKTDSILGRRPLKNYQRDANGKSTQATNLLVPMESPPASRLPPHTSP